MPNSDDPTPEAETERPKKGAGRSQWDDAHNQTQRYAPAPIAPKAPKASGGVGFRSVNLDSVTVSKRKSDADVPGGHSKAAKGSEGTAATAEADDWQAPTNNTQVYGTPAAPGLSNLSNLPAIAELDDVTAPGQDAWADASNETQQYGSPPSPVLELKAEATPHGAGAGAGASATDAWADAGDQATPTGDAWNDENNKTQRYSTTPLRAALSPPSVSSQSPWGSPDNHTAIYSTTKPPPNESTQPTQPAPRSATQPYGDPLSSADEQALVQQGQAEAGTLQEAAQLAVEDVSRHPPSPRGSPFSEIDLEIEETVDTDATPADLWHQVAEAGDDAVEQTPHQGFAERVITAKWIMPPPQGVPSSEAPDHHSKKPQPQTPEDFSLAPPEVPAENDHSLIGNDDETEDTETEDTGNKDTKTPVDNPSRDPPAR